MYRITAEKLIWGHINLERMKGEIRLTVKLLTSIFRRWWPKDRREIVLHSPNSPVWWNVERLSSGEFMVSCSVPADGGSNSLVTGFSTHGLDFPDVALIVPVYSALQILIDGLIEEFPKLTEKLEPYAKAAKISSV